MAGSLATLVSKYDDDNGNVSDDSIISDDTIVEANPMKRLKRSMRHDNFLSEIEYIGKARSVTQPRYVLHHQVYCDQRITNGHNHDGHPPTATFLDAPRLFAHDNRAAQLRGNEQVYDSHIYQDQNEDVCMIVYQRYSCHNYHEAMHDHFTKYAIPTDIKSIGPQDVRHWSYVLRRDGPLAIPTSEYISITSEHLAKAMGSLTRLIPRTFKGWNSHEDLVSPYSFFYHYVEKIQKFAKQLSSDDKRLVSVLLDYIVESQEEDFGEADGLFARGHVSRKHLGKVFRLDDIVLQNTPAGVRAFQIESIAEADDDAIELECVMWNFDGRFYRARSSFAIQRPTEDDTE